MLKITFIAKTTKEEAYKLPVRFRLYDGRKADISHKSSIRATEEDLEPFLPNGQLKPKRSLYNRNLFDSINTEIDLMKKAYQIMQDKNMEMSARVLDEMIENLRNPVSRPKEQRVKTLMAAFDEYLTKALRDGIIGERRGAHISIVRDKLGRFLHIKGLSYITAKEFDDELLMEFRQFLYEEYKFVPRFRGLYKDMKPQNIPEKRLSSNTVVSQLKMLQTFFAELEVDGDIDRSPFRQISRERKRAVMKTKYDEPIFLRADEFDKLRKAKVSKCYEEVRDAFLVNCAIGCRIEDFKNMTLDNIAVSQENIPYIHYLPHKTAGDGDTNAEVQTPLVRFAFDIIKRTGFQFRIIRNVYGKMGYNTQLKGLLKECGVDRKVPIFNEQTKANEYKPLYEQASSKLARKTHVDMLSKVQIDLYASGLHKINSNAVTRYTSMELKDRFTLLNLAFNEKAYKVNDKMEIK